MQRGVVDLDALRRQSDAEVIQALCRVKGIGRWTAEMYLIFSLHRLDVFPKDDQAIRASMMDLYRLTERGFARRAATIAERWRPYRSVASWYLYRHLEQSRARPTQEAAARKRPRSGRAPPARPFESDGVRKSSADVRKPPFPPATSEIPAGSGRRR